MGLKIRFLPPLNRILGQVRELDFSHPVSVAHVLRLLREQNPDFAPYAGFGPKDKHAYGLLVWRERKLLTLDDILAPTDEVEMIIMVAGG
jgi:hypothetical protein